MLSLSLARLVSAALVAALAAAQAVVEPSNATLPDAQSKSEFQLSWTGSSHPAGPLQYTIAPLTDSAGAGQTNPVDPFKIAGNIRIIDATNEPTVTTDDIAYISCDPSQGFIDPSVLVGKVGDVKPKAILLYSLSAKWCHLNGTYPFKSIYSMVASGDATSLFHNLEPNATVAVVIQNNTDQSSNSTIPDGTPGGPAPTTAVAMSILYSITGIITLLFLIVIASGAVRAHRHPERYGPRTGVTGRPRQSRAKGLARAMLETLPIVKFGDPEPVKPSDRDIEMEDGTSSVHHVAEVTGAAAVADTGAQTKNPPTALNAEAGSAPATHSEGAAGELGCSICTEDFTTGEDVRVLPCHHRYHPACIDPWLLNVSGTCPLCRHDLRPVPALGTEGEAAEGDELPPPLTADGEEHHTDNSETDAASHRHRLRVSRLLDLARLRTAPPEERIAALRQFREQSQQEHAASPASSTVEQQGISRRLTSRLRDTFRIRTRTQNAPES